MKVRCSHGVPSRDLPLNNRSTQGTQCCGMRMLAKTPWLSIVAAHLLLSSVSGFLIQVLSLSSSFDHVSFLLVVRLFVFFFIFACFSFSCFLFRSLYFLSLSSICLCCPCFSTFLPRIPLICSSLPHLSFKAALHTRVRQFLLQDIKLFLPFGLL